VDVRPCTAQLIAGGELNARALTRIEPARSLAKIAFERDDDLMLGDPVIVLGNLHELAHTVTGGVLSAGNREVRDGDGVLFRNLLQTDAAVNLGHSVGPLINADGELIGINVAILPESHNIGFGVPLGRVRAVRSIEEVGTPFDAVSPGLTAWRSVAEFERGTEYLPGRTQTAPATLN